MFDKAKIDGYNDRTQVNSVYRFLDGNKEVIIDSNTQTIKLYFENCDETLQNEWYAKTGQVIESNDWYGENESTYNQSR